jgi:hypothetical protein
MFPLALLQALNVSPTEYITGGLFLASVVSNAVLIEKVGRIDKTIHGNGRKGLVERVEELEKVLVRE